MNTLPALFAALASSSLGPLVSAAPAQDVMARPFALVLVLAAAAILPFAFMSLTAFVKISTVLQIVRGAIGAQNVPSNTIVIALSAALTVLAMAPIGGQIAERAGPVLEADRGDAAALVSGLAGAAVEPMRDFLSENSSERERVRFFQLAKKARTPENRAAVSQDDLTVIIPAFITTELLEAFALGFALYLPFLVIDLLVSNVLLALGMQMMNPTQVSLPFKLLLFVAVDGWGLLAQALVTSYAPG